MPIRPRFVVLVILVVLVAVVSVLGWAAAQTVLKVAYMPHPGQDQQIEWMLKWAESKPDVEIEPVPISYEVYIEKVTANFLARKSEYDLVWNNDDWGQLWGAHLEPVDDVAALADVERPILDKIHTWDGHDTAIPFTLTGGVFFYRTDLIPEGEFPKTWSELRSTLMHLQQADKVKWGLVGGMKYPHSWHTLFWSLWSNGADIMAPAYERGNAELKANGWRSMATDPKFIETIEWWWDNIHMDKITPPGITGYTRTDADALFMQGEAAVLFNDSNIFNNLNDPEKSKVAGRVATAPWPLGPSAERRAGWAAPWSWSIPKNADPASKEVAKDLLNFLLGSPEVQVDVWESTGGIPASQATREQLKEKDELFAAVAEATADAPQYVGAAYYFPEWPEVHSAVSAHVVRALGDAKEDIPEHMHALDREIGRILGR